MDAIGTPGLLVRAGAVFVRVGRAVGIVFAVEHAPERTECGHAAGDDENVVFGPRIK